MSRIYKGPPLRSEENINPPPERSPSAVMQYQGNDPDASQPQCIRRTCHASKDIRLTTPPGYDYHSPQWEVSPQDEAPQPMDIDTAGPANWLDHHLAEDIRVHDHSGLSVQSPYIQSPEDGSLPPGVVWIFISTVPVDYNSPREIAWSDGEDLGSPLRCGTDNECPIHLTTNISMAPFQVSYLHLVCRHLVWKTSWY